VLWPQLCTQSLYIHQAHVLSESTWSRSYAAQQHMADWRRLVWYAADSAQNKLNELQTALAWIPALSAAELAQTGPCEQHMVPASAIQRHGHTNKNIIAISRLSDVLCCLDAVVLTQRAT
jgi:hypothetical protein